MPCQKSHKLKDFVMGLLGGGHFVLFLINCYGVLLGIKLHSLYGDSCSAHISHNFFNTIPIGLIYFLFTMDLKTGVMIPGHQQVDDFLGDDFLFE